MNFGHCDLFVICFLLFEFLLLAPKVFSYLQKVVKKHLSAHILLTPSRLGSQRASCGKSISSNIEPAHKLKIDQNKLQNCRSNILNLVNVL
ncbi:hypothetical protein D1AOALGA4SA_1646 [Olavius algarvensis Delta 1 endosymbiont]|nr:hypothetical protein D1AOALGA4SA_1646 [Olavius algarvensis Delta 1 endosymbiont]